MIDAICKHCSAAFKNKRTGLRGGKISSFCSRSCAAAGTARRKTMISCVCAECRKNFSARKGRGGTMTYCSAECRAIGNGKNLRAELHPNWKGGISERPSRARTAVKRRLKVIKTCEKCGATGHLHGHHIKPYSAFPELMDDPTNIEILCTDCHAQEHPHLAALIRRPIVRGGADLACQVCDAEFYARPYKADTARFCSHPCQLLYLHVLRHQHV